MSRKPTTSSATSADWPADPTAPIWLIATGEAPDEVLAQYGCFADWFDSALLPPDSEHLAVFDVVNEGLPPKDETPAGIVVTGSKAMVSHKAEWSEAAAAWLATQARRGVPILGICYGHQLLAHGLGGKVGPNPHGRQMGTTPVHLESPASTDALLAGLPGTFKAQTSHLESVLALPEGAVRLASSPKDPNHAFRFGERAWGLQFHPEFTPEVTRAYIEARVDAIREEGLDPEQMAAGVVETPLSYSLMERFYRLAMQHG